MLQKTYCIFFNILFLLFTTKCVSSDSKNPFIIIIGAGASGIAAATKLLKNNVTHIRILEAEDRIGGRINSIKFGDAFIDLGAEFCHGESNNIVYDMVKDLNILKNSKDDGAFFQSTGAEVKSRLGEKIYKVANELNFGEENNTCATFKSVGDCLDDRFAKLLSNAEDDYERDILEKAKPWLHNAIAAYDSPLDLHDLSTKTQFEDSDGDLHLNWNGLGYKTILDIMMQKYPTNSTPLIIDDKIFLNEEVSRISKWDQDEELEVTCRNGNTYFPDFVLFSPSLGVLKANHMKLFKPALPQSKLDAINNIGFGVIMKIFMEFPIATDLDYPIMRLFRKDEFVKRENLSWLTSLVALVPAPNNPKVIVGWYAGKELPRIEALSDEEVLEGQKYLTMHFLFDHLNFTVEEPIRIARSKWYKNPHFRGTYSYEISDYYFYLHFSCFIASS